MPADRSPTVRNVTGEEIIEELLRNLDQSLEPLRYTVYAPSVFDIYLHPTDLDRLTGILPQIAEEARQALEERLAEHQKGGQPGGLMRMLSSRKGQAREYKNVAGGWFISFFENTDPEAHPGDILIDSRLTLPKGPDLEGTNRTRRISTLRSEGTHRVVESRVLDANQARHELPSLPAGPSRAARSNATQIPAAPPAPVLTQSPARVSAQPMENGSERPVRAELAGNSTRPMPAHEAPGREKPAFSPHVTTERRPSGNASSNSGNLSGNASGSRSPEPVSAPQIEEASRARLSFTDQSGPHVFELLRSEVTVGRGGTGHWVDIKVDAIADVSRTHFKIRRDERGRFFIRDLSAYGTTVDNHRLTSSLEMQGDRKIDRMREELLPPRARIGLADVIYMDFEVLPS